MPSITCKHFFPEIPLHLNEAVGSLNDFINASILSSFFMVSTASIWTYIEHRKFILHDQKYVKQKKKVNEIYTFFPSYFLYAPASMWRGWVCASKTAKWNGSWKEGKEAAWCSQSIRKLKANLPLKKRIERRKILEDIQAAESKFSFKFRVCLKQSLTLSAADTA